MKDAKKIDVNHVQITSLSHIQGQPQVVDILQLYLCAYFNIKSTSESPNFGPVTLTGPSGTGKTMVAKAIHAELGNLKLTETNGVAVNNKTELFSILINADANTTVFIDEAQGMNTKTQHILLTAISERQLSIPASKPSQSPLTVPLADFTIIMATTHEYLLQEALRNRMRINCRFHYYSVDDLTEIVRQRVDALKWEYESEQVLQIIARRAKGTPRLALNTNLQTCWCVAKSHNRDLITISDVYEAFSYLKIDEAGLDELERSYLATLEEYGRLPVGVLSSKLSLPALTLMKATEPYLIREGFISKDKTSARVITQKGKEHISTASPYSRIVEVTSDNVTE